MNPLHYLFRRIAEWRDLFRNEFDAALRIVERSYLTALPKEPPEETDETG